MFLCLGGLSSGCFIQLFHLFIFAGLVLPLEVLVLALFHQQVSGTSQSFLMCRTTGTFFKSINNVYCNLSCLDDFWVNFAVVLDFSGLHQGPIILVLWVLEVHQVLGSP